MKNKTNYIKEVSNRVLHSAKFLERMGFFNKEIKESLFLKQKLVNTLDKINKNQNDYNLIEETLNFYFDLKKSIYENADLLVKSYIFQKLPDVFEDEETKRDFVFNLQKIDFEDLFEENDDLLEIIEVIEKEAKKLFTLINSIIADIEPDTSVEDLYLVLFGTKDTNNGIDNSENNENEGENNEEIKDEEIPSVETFNDNKDENEIGTINKDNTQDNSNDSFIEQINDTVDSIKENMVVSSDVFQSPIYAITAYSSNTKKDSKNKIKKTKTNKHISK